VAQRPAGSGLLQFPLLKARAGIPEDEEIEVYEEIKFEPTVMCDVLERGSTLQQLQLEDGDILVLQRVVPTVRTDGPLACKQVEKRTRSVTSKTKWLSLGPCSASDRPSQFTLTRGLWLEGSRASTRSCGCVSCSLADHCLLGRLSIVCEGGVATRGHETSANKGHDARARMCSQEEVAKLRFPTAQLFLDYVRKRTLVHFKRLEAPKVWTRSRHRSVHALGRQCACGLANGITLLEGSSCAQHPPLSPRSTLIGNWTGNGGAWLLLHLVAFIPWRHWFSLRGWRARRG
jgi:ICP0-binding domain of Ubiquitin-specific protease 7